MKKITYLMVCVLGLVFVACQPAVKSVELDADNVTLSLDSSDVLHAKITPASLPDSILVWESTDTSVVCVNDGVIRGKKVGNADVVVWADDQSDTCHVCVKVRVDSISLNVKSVRIKSGGRAKLKARVYPSNATDTLINWTSSDSSVAIVSRGVVHAKEKGTVIITATVDGQSVDCRVSVATLREWQTEMSRQAQRRGGNVGGALRFTLMWNDQQVWNQDDLDAHCIEPTGNEISYKNFTSRSGGRLDVDNRWPHSGEKAVENISWNSLGKLKKGGKYQFSVHRYADRLGKGGFRAEIEFDGQVYSYNYNGKWNKKKNWPEISWNGNRFRKVGYVPVANVRVDDEGDLYIENILQPVNQ
ncbi:MAG: Ig domain-containing protein [Paludibacteraceae bacterium]|nr:Ig domain-containing protein [Paludibacteraceae bacterium]